MTRCRPTFYRIWKKRAVEQYSAIPYVATLLNCMLWVFYGLPIVHPNSILVVTINGIGLVIEAAYLTIFFIYSDSKKRVSAAILRIMLFPPSIDPIDLVSSLIRVPQFACDSCASIRVCRKGRSPSWPWRLCSWSSWWSRCS